MKYAYIIPQYDAVVSLPVRGAWIEMSSPLQMMVVCGSSLPVRGAWIEIVKSLVCQIQRPVAPRAGSVD